MITKFEVSCKVVVHGSASIYIVNVFIYISVSFSMLGYIRLQLLIKKDSNLIDSNGFGCIS